MSPVTTNPTCCICAEEGPIIFTNTCNCPTVIHVECYNTFLRNNQYKCPICRQTVEPMYIDDSKYCFPLLFCMFTY